MRREEQKQRNAYMLQSTLEAEEKDCLSPEFQEHTGQRIEMPISVKNRAEQEKHKNKKTRIQEKGGITDMCDFYHCGIYTAIGNTGKC